MLEKAISQASKMVLTIDTETTGLDWVKETIYLVGYRIDRGVVKQFEPKKDGWPEEFVSLLADSKVTKRYHNGKFDVLMLKAAGLKVNGLIDDTQILAYLDNPFRPVGLKALVEGVLQKPVTRMDDFGFKPLKKDLKAFADVGFDTDAHYFKDSEGQWYRKDLMYEYNRDDVLNCDSLRNCFLEGDWYKNVEQQITEQLVGAEAHGIRIDRTLLEALHRELEGQLEVLGGQLGGINPRSPKQVATLLGLPAGSPTDKIVLKHLAWGGNEKAKQILEYRRLSKLYTTYTTPILARLDDNGYLHGSFNQAGREKGDGEDTEGTRTGRLSSSDPNLQNIPARTELGKRVRQSFVPSPGKRMADSDLKQIEPRTVAHYTQNPFLLKAYKEKLDTHALMGAVIFEKQPDQLTKMERFIGKTCWLADFYGCYAEKLKYICEINSDDPIPYDVAYFEDIRKRLRKNNPQLYDWREQHIARVKATGFIQTIGGRIINIPNLHSRKYGERMEAERRAVNYIIQGSAADIMKLIMVKFYRELPEFQLLAVVHDEVLGEFPETYDVDSMLWHINRIMTKTVKLNNVPIECDTFLCKSWADKK